MARSLNKAQIIGNLGEDPELRYTGSGTAVANLRVATNETWTSNGEEKSKTEWHSVVCWKSLAEVVNEHLHKGSRLYVEGRLETRTWEDRDGNERQTTQIVADEVIFLGGDGQNAGRQRPNETRQKQPAGPQQGEKATANETFEPDDELPF